MRVAVLSDIHGNLTALEAVLADLRSVAPDLVIHGGDLADAGSSPVEVVDYIRDLGWEGVMGNTDEMLVQPGSLEEFARTSEAPPALWSKMREMADVTRQRLGHERLAWLSRLPLALSKAGLAVVHASPGICWRAPTAVTTDDELQAAFGSVDQPIVVFGHIHQPLIRKLTGHPRLIANAGSVGLSFDGDPRASYLLLEDNAPSIRRVKYDLEKEIAALGCSGLPGSKWTARMLRAASPQMP